MTLPARIILIVIYIVAEAHGNCVNWTEYSECSMTCGGGTQTRVRTCTDQGEIVTETETQMCNTANCSRSCTGFSSWSDCSRSCGPDAYQLRVRQCTQMGEECILQKETEEEIKYCEIKSCNPCTTDYCKWFSSVGYVPDPADCSSWYVCEVRKKGKKYKKTRHTCPGGLLWNNDKLTCDFDKAADTVCILQNYTETSTKTPIKETGKCPYKRLGDYKFIHKTEKTVQACNVDDYFDEEDCVCLPRDLGDLNQDIHTETTDCDCLYIPFDGHINGEGCNSAHNQAVPEGVSYVAGVEHEAITLPGQQRVISAMFSNWLGGSARVGLTISMWIYPACGESFSKVYQGLIGISGCDPVTRFEIHLDNGSVCFALTVGSENITYCHDQQLPCEEWTYIALLVKDGSLVLIIDGTAVYQRAVSGLVADQVGALSIGHGGYRDDQYYTGYIDELYVCRRPFTDTELQGQLDLWNP